MSLITQFAKEALAGLLANPENGRFAFHGDKETDAYMAERAFDIAYAMEAERERRKKLEHKVDMPCLSSTR